MPPSAPRWKGAVASAVLAVALVVFAYRLPALVSIDFGRPLDGLLGSSGFFDAEGSYRWSRAASEIVFPDPGASSPVSIEIDLAGFRPRGAAPPRVVVESGGRTVVLLPDRRRETYSLETATAGVWSSTARLQIRSDTFSPGGGDERALGVRVHGARLRLPKGAWAPLKQVISAAATAAGVALLFGARGGVLAALLLGAGFAFFRFHAASLAPVFAWGAPLSAAATRWIPGIGAFASDYGRALIDGARGLRSRAFFVLLGSAVAATFAAYALREDFEIGLGTGLAEPLLMRFAGLDRDEAGVLFRRPFPGASIDLGDFGTSSPWRVTVRFSPDATAGFEAREVELPAPRWGMSSGHVLRFPGIVAGRDLRIVSLSVDRGRSFPPGRALALVAASLALFTAAFGACGLSRRGTFGCGTVATGLLIAGLGTAPVFFVPLLGTVAISALAALLAASGARALMRELPASALAVATAGLVLWFLSTSSPLYAGGHFQYHTSVAEEISQGKFFLYYFPGPDNMLSHQPQWGNLTVPHPSFYHSVTSPLALLPRVWFHLATKLFLSLLLFGIALVSAAVAGKKAAAHAAFAAAALPTSWQLLGLGHLMTLFGTFAAALALGFVAAAETRLLGRRVWLTALALTTFAFLSYTGSLLFGSLALFLAAGALLRPEPRLSKALGWLLLAGWGLALALYYVHWVQPFFQETLPSMLSGSGAERGIDWGARLRLAPSKLEYTFGAFWVPVVGLLGLALAEGRARRYVLYGWAAALPLFSALDLAFNFLLKHHYFSFPAVAIGIGLALRRLHEKNRPSRMVFLLFLVYLWVGGVAAVVRIATGTPF
jgi:hypothetical protein